MPYHHWLRVVAIGCLIVLSLAVHAQEGEETDGQEQVRAQQGATRQTPWAIPVDIVEEQTEVEARQAREQRSEKRERDELLAQQRMNEATQRMADYALWQTILIGVGTILLIVTLWLTRQANWAAQEAVNVTREQMVHQLRAYISLFKSEIQDVSIGACPRAHLAIRNDGATPAIIKKHRAWMSLTWISEPVKLAYPDDGKRGRNTTLDLVEMRALFPGCRAN